MGEQDKSRLDQLSSFFDRVVDSIKDISEPSITADFAIILPHDDYSVIVHAQIDQLKDFDTKKPLSEMIKGVAETAKAIDALSKGLTKIYYKGILITHGPTS